MVSVHYAELDVELYIWINEQDPDPKQELRTSMPLWN